MYSGIVWFYIKLGTENFWSTSKKMSVIESKDYVINCSSILCEVRLHIQSQFNKMEDGKRSNDKIEKRRPFVIIRIRARVTCLKVLVKSSNSAQTKDIELTCEILDPISSNCPNRRERISKIGVTPTSRRRIATVRFQRRVSFFFLSLSVSLPLHCISPFSFPRICALTVQKVSI